MWSGDPLRAERKKKKKGNATKKEKANKTNHCEFNKVSVRFGGRDKSEWYRFAITSRYRLDRRRDEQEWCNFYYSSFFHFDSDSNGQWKKSFYSFLFFSRVCCDAVAWASVLVLPLEENSTVKAIQSSRLNWCLWPCRTKNCMLFVWCFDHEINADGRVVCVWVLGCYVEATCAYIFQWDFSCAFVRLCVRGWAVDRFNSMLLLTYSPYSTTTFNWLTWSLFSLRSCSSSCRFSVRISRTAKSPNLFR